jgi:pyrroline-5-carboxylate reductase
VAAAQDTGDGPAAVVEATIGYLTVALQGIEDGAIAAGLPQDTVRVFVTQTLLTTARLLQEHPGSPADLKDQVASPGGTTITGLGVLEERAVRGALMKAMRDAVESSTAKSGAPRGASLDSSGVTIKRVVRAARNEGREK